MKEKNLEVHFSRQLSALLILIGGFFVFVGLDMMIFHLVFVPLESANPTLGLIFQILALIVGAGLVLLHLYTFIRMPLLLRVDSAEITFATGFLYQGRYSIPTRYLEAVDLITVPNMVQLSARQKPNIGGVILKFREEPEVPRRVRTPAGLNYIHYRLHVFKNHMNPGPKRALEEIKRITRR